MPKLVAPIRFELIRPSGPGILNPKQPINKTLNSYFHAEKSSGMAFAVCASFAGYKAALQQSGAQ